MAIFPTTINCGNVTGIKWARTRGGYDPPGIQDEQPFQRPGASAYQVDVTMDRPDAYGKPLALTMHNVDDEQLDNLLSAFAGYSRGSGDYYDGLRSTSEYSLSVTVRRSE